jgi:phosphohistidine phosphatase SixA
MRELILLRHAHAEPAGPGMSDPDRALSMEGLAEAEAAGRWLAARGLVPDRVLVSPARRTRETLERVLAAVGYADTRTEPRIYEATPGTLIALADEHRDAGRLLLVGHNPGLEHLAALMSTGQSGDFRGMPPAGIVVLHLPADADLEPGIATVDAYWIP